MIGTKNEDIWINTFQDNPLNPKLGIWKIDMILYEFRVFLYDFSNILSPNNPKISIL